MTRKNSIRHLVWIVLSFFLVACSPKERPEDFFQKAGSDESFFTTFSLLNPDTVVDNIQRRVPPKWHQLACESAYYWFTNLHGSEPDSIRFVLIDALDEHFKEDQIQVFTDMIRGELYLEQRLFDSAAYYLEQSYQLSLTQNIPLRETDILVQLGNLEMRRYDYPSAIQLLLKAHQQYQNLLNKENDRGRTTEFLPDLGDCYQYNKDYQAANFWYHKYWAHVNSEQGFRMNRMFAATKLSENHLSLNQLDSAQIMMDSAIYNLQYNNSDYQKAYLVYTQGNLAYQLGNCEQAVSLLQQAQKKFEQANRQEKQFHYYHDVGRSYHCLNQMDSAMHYFERALAAPDSMLIMDVHQSLAQLFSDQNLLQKALVHTTLSNQLKARLFQSSKIKEVGYLAAKLEADQKIQAILYQDKIKKYRFAVGILSLSLLLGLTFFLLFSQKKKNKLLEYQKSKMADLATIKALELQSTQQKLQSTHLKLQDTSDQLQLKQTILDRLQERIDAQKLNKKELKSKDINILKPQDWDQFQENFEREYPHFLTNLKEKHPKLSAAETRMAILIKIGFNNTELAKILNISAASIYKSRYRLRKKIQLPKGVELQDWIQEM